MEVITFAGEVLKDEKQASGEPLVIDQFILANIAGQNHAEEIDRARGLPEAEDIVYTSGITRAAYVAESEVVYSLFMGSGVDGFSFNTLYLVCTEDNNTVFAIATLPETLKIADGIGSGTRGTGMTRNFILAFDDAQAITELTAKAEAWQTLGFNEATESIAGIAEIATQAETELRQDDKQIVTSLKLTNFWNSVFTWENIEHKPVEYPPELHTHYWKDVRNVPDFERVENTRMGEIIAFTIWMNPGNTDSPGLIMTKIHNWNADPWLDHGGIRPLQKFMRGAWYTVSAR